MPNGINLAQFSLKASALFTSNRVYAGFNKSVITALPKKAGADICENADIQSSLYDIRGEYRREKIRDSSRFGFRKNMGAIEAMLSLRLILERRMKKNKATFTAFVCCKCCLEKAFDNVQENVTNFKISRLYFIVRFI